MNTFNLKLRILFLGIFLFLYIFLSPTTKVYAQCAMCKANIESGQKTGGKVGLGLNVGILYLLAAPYLLVGSIGAYWYFSNKKNKTTLNVTPFGNYNP